MSAKRRQEAIARFSVPLEDSGDLDSSTHQRVSQGTRNIEAASDDTNSDFVMNDNNSSSLPTTRKTKGKGKATETSFQDFNASDENPRVMLLSLKAVRSIIVLMNNAENSTYAGSSRVEFDW